MPIYKNTASQRVAVFAFDETDGSKKTGDAANLSAQIAIDGGSSAAITASATEADATNHPGIYYYSLTAGETNGDCLVITASSATSNVAVDPVVIYTADASAYQADVSALATASALGDVDTVADSILVIADKLDSALEADGDVSRFTANALEQAPSGTGGDATAANQTSILAKLSTATGNVTQNPADSVIELIKGDDYDGTANASLTWTVTGKTLDAATITLTIRDRADSVALTTTGSGSGEVATVSLSATQTDSLAVGKYKFDLQITYSGGSLQTAAVGSVVVEEAQTR